jgi:hypothetical protein
MKRGGMEELDKAIYDLYKLESEPSTQALRIIIVSTLAGGTGSGLILPVSMYIKQFLKTRIQIPGSVTRGFFILPEIMYDAVTAEPMRNAFKTNAYAVLRELNAFILKADGNLPERYKDKVHLMFPKVGTNEFEEYDVLPMDFCFLFDAQNIEGKKLNSTEQYINHAATCIYAQSIGPMNTRSYSSEDNTIRTLAAGQSRNRYAGAGASELLYPSKHIIRHIALNWASQTVSQQWTKFDREFKKQSIENKRDRMKGHAVKEITIEKAYIDSVDNKVSEDEDDVFSMFVQNSCYDLDKDGRTQTGNKWGKYIDALQEFIKVRAESGQSETENSYEATKSAIESLTTKGFDARVFIRAYNYLIEYKESVKRHYKEVARNASYQLFKAEREGDITLSDNGTQIESHMKDNSKEFMHPNAIRYFLYQTLNTIEERTASINKANNVSDGMFKNLDDLFVDEELGIKTVNQFAKKIDDRNWLERWVKKHQNDIDKFIGDYESQFANITKYKVNAPYAIILKEANKFVKNLSKSFEIFYTSFESKIGEIDRQIATSEEKYTVTKGNTIRYVCASPKCLKELYKKMEFTGNAIQLPDEICRKIYKEVRTHALTPRASADSSEVKDFSYFNNIFENVIIKHFKDSVMDAYGSDIKVDVLKALEIEAKYEEDTDDRERIADYVKKVIDDTKKLADPFINRPIGEEPVVIESCAYNKNLMTEDPQRKDFVLSELKTFGGVECEKEINTETILFYCAIYGLFPEDLLKFSPPLKSLSKNDGAGEYNKAYYDMINRIGPDPLTTPVITPHIHKNWHLISELPDLNDELQKEQEQKIYKALILGILYNCIEYEKVGEKYKYSLWLGGGKDIQLATSDGSLCDSFYKVIDALTINPVIVNRILDYIENEIDKARQKNVIKYEDSTFYTGVSELVLPELSHDNKKMSIFGIAAAFKATMPPEDFILDHGLMLLKTILETVYEQIEKLCPDNERDNRYISLIEKQFDLFQSNFEFYKKEHPSVIDNYLRELLGVVEEVLSAKEFSEAANKVRERRKNLFGAENTRNSQKVVAAKKAGELKTE